jgi:hypothetical protein
LYQKQLLQAGKSETVRPPIKFFKFGSYRGKPSHNHNISAHPNTDSAPK